MIKSLDLSIQAYAETRQQLEKLKLKQNTMSTDEYKKARNKIYRQRYKQLKQIEKEYPLEEEIEKFLKEA